MAIVYVFTNESMQGMVKIGHSDRTVKGRLKQLDGTGVPLPFECFYAVEVGSKDIAYEYEKNLHRGLEKYRVRKGREFFNMTPEQAKALVKNAELLGGIDVTPNDDIVDSDDDRKAVDKARERNNKSFRFSMAGIKPGTELHFVDDNSIKCKVIDDRQIEFRGEITSMSRAATVVLKELKDDSNWVQTHKGYVNGTKYWCIDDKTVSDMRDELDSDIH